MCKSIYRDAASKWNVSMVFGGFNGAHRLDVKSTNIHQSDRIVTHSTKPTSCNSLSSALHDISVTLKTFRPRLKTYFIGR